MKKVVLASVLCFVTFLSGYSQTKQESIKELFHLMQTDSMIDKSFSTMIPAIQNQMQGLLKDSVARVHSKEMMNSLMKTAKEISKKMMDEDLVVLYDKYFTQGEVDDFIRFYKTPSGQKMIKIMPEMQKEIMIIMMQKYMPELQKSIKVQTDELIKNRKN
jgi:hypothetical protein